MLWSQPRLAQLVQAGHRTALSVFRDSLRLSLRAFRIGLQIEVLQHATMLELVWLKVISRSLQG